MRGLLVGGFVATGLFGGKDRLQGAQLGLGGGELGLGGFQGIDGFQFRHLVLGIGQFDLRWKRADGEVIESHRRIEARKLELSIWLAVGEQVGDLKFFVQPDIDQTVAYYQSQEVGFADFDGLGDPAPVRVGVFAATGIGHVQLGLWGMGAGVYVIGVLAVWTDVEAESDRPVGGASGMLVAAGHFEVAGNLRAQDQPIGLARGGGLMDGAVLEFPSFANHFP